MRQGLSPCSWRHSVAVVISYQMRKLDSTASAASDSMATMKAAWLPLTGAGDFVLWTCHHRLSASLSLPLSLPISFSLYVSLSFFRGCCWQCANKICKAQKLIKLNQICFRHFSSTLFSLFPPPSLYLSLVLFLFFSFLSVCRDNNFKFFWGIGSQWFARACPPPATAGEARQGS